MSTLIFSTAVSLDGYIAGPDGAIDWAAPDQDVMRFHNEQSRELTGHLTGRKLYETMLGWETAEQTRTDPLEIEFARIWTAVPKLVFSRTLTAVEGNARLATRDVVDEATALRDGPGDGIVSVGGAGLAAELARNDLIDEYRLFVNPVVLGGGTPYFPPLPKRLALELLETRNFSHVTYLRYRRSS